MDRARGSGGVGRDRDGDRARPVVARGGPGARDIADADAASSDIDHTAGIGIARAARIGIDNGPVSGSATVDVDGSGIDIAGAAGNDVAYAADDLVDVAGIGIDSGDAGGIDPAHDAGRDEAGETADATEAPEQAVEAGNHDEHDHDDDHDSAAARRAAARTEATRAETTGAVRPERQDMRLVNAAIACVLLTAQLAHAECPPGQAPASCALHDEGVAAFTAGKYEEAATKFRAAIAAGPTARSYLGYSQAVEGQGKLALAYDTMLVAQKLSNEELAKPGAAQDPVLVGRAERIKYKLAELAQKIGYVWLRLPPNVPASRVVAVYRQGEGDLASPIGRWVVVAANRQILFATLDDGTRLEMLATVSPGSQATIVIPVPIVQTAPTAPPPVTQPAFVQPTMPGQDPNMPSAPPAERAAAALDPARTVLTLDAAFVLRDAGELGSGIGFGAVFERAVTRRLALTGRGAFVFHPSQEAIDLTQTTTVSGSEGLVFVGARTRSKLPLYASVEVGALIFAIEQTTSAPAMPDTTDSFSHTYAALLAGGGVRLGKVHFELYMLSVANTTDADIPLRFFATFGVDLVRR